MTKVKTTTEFYVRRPNGYCEFGLYMQVVEKQGLYTSSVSVTEEEFGVFSYDVWTPCLSLDRMYPDFIKIKNKVR